ncbi:MAG: GNAT family N-acetyltransferase [Cellulomonas sp.]|jgi:predicted acetyltransferase|nr:GNAT family N-acetyltransferase [Cellulomonas sp.]
MADLPAGYQLRPITAADVPAVMEFDRYTWAFPVGDDEGLPPYPAPLDRSWMVEAPDGSLAAMHGSFPFRLPVPGGEVPAAGLTWVGVGLGHRRRGLLRVMIEHHLARTVARGEAVSILGASEEAIYGRFGYGRASDELRATVERGAALRPAADDDSPDLHVTVTTASPDAADLVELVDTVHRAAGRGRPGWVGRDLPRLRTQVLTDPPGLREGTEPLRVAVVRAPDGAARGYALLRRTARWLPEGARFAVKVEEAVAVDTAAHRRLWSFLLDLDLTATVETPGLACDDPLWHLLVDRRATVPRLSDNLWLRVVDLPQALAARRCAAPVDVVLDVRDGLIAANQGKWRVRSPGPDAPTEVTSTDQAADIELDVRDLGAVYLGGTRLTALADAGLVVGRTAGAVARAGTAFSWGTAPLCSWMF